MTTLALAVLALCLAAAPEPASGQVAEPASGEVAEPASGEVAEPEGFRGPPYRVPVPATLTGAETVGTAAAKELWDAGEAFVDVLPQPPRPDLPEGTYWQSPQRRNIPGSRWLANTGYEALSVEVTAYFAEGLIRATGGNPSAPVVIYCQSECWMSWNAAKRALALGYSAVKWYPEGTDGWAAAGLPLEPAEPDPGFAPASSDEPPAAAPTAR